MQNRSLKVHEVNTSEKVKHTFVWCASENAFINNSLLIYFLFSLDMQHKPKEE